MAAIRLVSKTIIPSLVARPDFPVTRGLNGLFTASTYTNINMFFKNKDESTNFMDPDTIRTSFQRAIQDHWLYTGRLIPVGRGRYDMKHFDRGAVFCESQSDLSYDDMRKRHFSFSAVPHGELNVVKASQCTESPMVALRLTHFRDRGGACLTVNGHHGIGDGFTLFQMIELALQYARGQPPSSFPVYDADWWTKKRSRYDFSSNSANPYQFSCSYREMSRSEAAKRRQMALSQWNRVTERRLLRFTPENLLKLKEHVRTCDSKIKDAKISTCDALQTFFLHELAKARSKLHQYTPTLVFPVNMRIRYSQATPHNGNVLLMPEYKKKDRHESMAQTALNIRKLVRAQTVEEADALADYCNQANDLSLISTPARRLTPGGLVWSNWSMYPIHYDFGWGKAEAVRSDIPDNHAATAIQLPRSSPSDDAFVSLQADSHTMREITDPKKAYFKPFAEIIE
ncbi:transferase [Gongronella butleri]|nr:transferase [Gongronella butleri]